jgi:hypothetical protein
MTRHVRAPGPGWRSVPTVDRGQTAATLADLDPATERGVRLLRLWCDHGAGAVEAAFTPALGHEAAARAACAFDRLCLICATMGQRPLSRHCACCPFLGADEARFAALLADATVGERDRAFGLALGLVRADFAGELVLHATQAGLAIRRALLREDRGKRLLH